MKFYLIWILLIIKALCLVFGRDFSYSGPMGPDHWGEEYGSCNGKHQSPINIDLLDVKEKPFALVDFESFYEKPLSAQLINNGHTVVVRYDFVNVPKISKGPLDLNTYKFAQLHFHWGQNSLEGSEDRINNQSFAAELHMVFSDIKYANFSEALKHNSGIAVLAFFFEVVPEGPFNSPYDKFTMFLKEIEKPNTTTEYMRPPALIHMLSGDFNEYYTYIGSLTTPPCSEDVLWIDYDYPIIISEKQIERFRQLKTFDGSPLTHNYRPIQPLNNRKIYHYSYQNTDHGKPFIKNASHQTKCHILTIFTCSLIVLLLKSFI